MKKIFYYFICTISAAAALIACDPEEKKDKPDGIAAIESFTLTMAANDFLDIDLNAVIDNDTIRIPAPKKDGALFDTVYVPTIKLTKGDVLTVVDTLGNSSPYEEGFKFKLSDKVSFVASDESVTPAVTQRYGIAFLDNDRIAALTSFVFAKDDNTDLEEDCVVDDFNTATLSVSLPKAANGKQLSATVSATINDEITINKQIVANGGKVTIDTAFPVDIEVVDKVTGEKTTYTIKFSKQSADIISVEKVTSFKPTDLQGWVTMAIDGDTPYVAYYAGPAAATRYAYVAKLGAEGFVQVGDAISERTNAVYIDIMDSTPYVMYMDYPQSSTFTVKKFNGTSWDLVGNRGEALVKATGLLSAYQHSFIIDPATSNPIAACTSNAAVTDKGLVKRGSVVGIYNGTSWAVSPGPFNTDDMWYTPRLARSSNAVYLLFCNQSKKTMSLYKYSGNTWTSVAEEISVGGTDLGTTSVALACDQAGEPYAAIASNATGFWICTIYKFSEGKAVKAYNSIPGVTFGNTNAIFDLAFDKSNKPIVAYVTENCVLKAMVEDPDTKTWASGITVEETVAAKQLALDVDTKGNAYIAAIGTDGGNAINLYKVSYK